MNPMVNLSEIFLSIQGEGLYVGNPQIFIRFAGCHVNCRYCDSPDARSVTPYFNYEQTPGIGDFIRKRNFVSADELVQLLKPHMKLTKFLAITGGEPLLQTDFLLELLPKLKALNSKMYLETNGMLYSSLEKVVEYVDVIAMDIKLRSTSELKIDREIWERFLSVSKNAHKEVFVKAVIGSNTTFDEINFLSGIVSGIDSNITLVLQPVTPLGGVLPPDQNSLIGMALHANKRLKNVMVVPQTHKLMGVR